MSSLCTNLKSVHFPISGNELNNFLKTNTGQYFASKSLSIHNIHFNVYVYPNGIDKKNTAYVQFIVVPNRFESTIKSVTVCCKLFCSIFQIMFKEVRILNNEKDSIEWSQNTQYQLPLSEYQKMIFKNGINELDFVCDIEVLKIKYKSNSYTIPNISRKLSNISLRKQSSTSLASVFQPKTLPVKSHVTIEWIITNKIIHLFKNSVNKKCIYSQDINNMWCFCIYPNGTKHRKNGNDVELDLKLIRLPEKIKSIEVDFVVKITQQQKEQSIEKLLQSRRKVVFSYDKSHELTKLFSTNKLDKIDSFTLTIIIKLIRIFEYTNRGNGKEITTHWKEFNVDEFQPGVFKCNIDYGENKTDNYYIDEAKSSHSNTGITDIIENNQNISISISNPIQRKLQQKDTQELARKPSYSTTGNSSLSPPSTRNKAASITAPSTQDKEIDIKPWSDNNIFMIQTNNNNALNTLEEQCDDNIIINQQKEDIFFIKFKQWLADEVQLEEYLPKFIQSKSANIKLVKAFDHQTLMECIGINNSAHRNLILAEAKSFKQGQDNFEELIKKHDRLKSFRKNFRKNAILTDVDLENMSKYELQKVLSVESEDIKLNQVWDIIHETQSQHILPAVSQKQLQMQQYQEQYNVMKTAMDEWLTQLLKMHHEASDQKEADAILDDYSSRLIDHRTILEQFMVNSRYEKIHLSKAETLAHGISLDKERDTSNNTSTEKTSTEKTYTSFAFSHVESDKVVPELADIKKKISFFDSFTQDDNKKNKSLK